MGVFLIIAPIVEALARALKGTTRRDGATPWAAFVQEYLVPFDSRYGRLAGLYHGYRNIGSHNLSGEGVAFLSGPTDNGLHLDDGGGFLRLHMETLMADVERAFASFKKEAIEDPAIGRVALAHFDKVPPVGAYVPEKSGDVSWAHVPLAPWLGALSASIGAPTRLAGSEEMIRRILDSHKRPDDPDLDPKFDL